MHVAQWEQALLAKVEGRPRHEALGIDATTDGSGDDDTINAAEAYGEAPARRARLPQIPLQNLRSRLTNIALVQKNSTSRPTPHLSLSSSTRTRKMKNLKSLRSESSRSCLAAKPSH